MIQYPGTRPRIYHMLVISQGGYIVDINMIEDAVMSVKQALLQEYNVK